MKRLISLLFLTILVSVLVYGQSSTITLNAPGPLGVSGVSTSRIGNQGNNNFYYWVIANYASGQGNGLSPAQARNAPSVLDGSNYIQVTWNFAPGAVSYDVLRTTTSSLPSPCTCALATGLTTFTYNNQNNTLSSYTYAPIGPAVATLSLNNTGYALPRLLMSRQMDFYLGPYTIANLPSPDPLQKYRFQVITDGASSTDCTVGGSSGLVVCIDNGTGWVSAGTGGSGAGTVTNVTWTGGIVSIANSTTTPAFTIAGTSGGIPYFNSGTTWLTSAALGSGQFVLGGGAGSAPSTSFSVVPVANGGTALASGTSGGLLGYTASGVLASSVALGANLPIIGGGAGATPTTGTRSGNTTAFVTTTGTQTSGRCVVIDGSGNHVADTGACGGGGGSGTVTSVGWTGGIVSIATPTTTPAFTIAGTSGGLPYFNSASTWLTSAALANGQFVLGGGAGGAPSTSFSVIPVANGGTNLASGTSGGVLAYTGSGTIASSGALTANLPVIGGGAGAVPTVGTRSGNTTAFVTTTGTQTSGNCVQIDANGNHIASGSACGSGGSGSGPVYTTTTFSATPTFTVSTSTIQVFTITLTGNVTSSTLTTTLAQNGQDITFNICQDGTGSRTFVWPTNVSNPSTIVGTASTCSIQTFRYDGTNAFASTGLICPLCSPSLVVPGVTSGTNTVAPAAVAGTSTTFLAANGTTVIADTGASNNFLTAVSATGVISKAQPTCANLSNSAIGCSATEATNAQTGTYQVLAADFTNKKTITVASGTFTITLVASGSQPADGQSIQVINYGSGVVTIARSGQNINGGTTSLTLPASTATAPTSAYIKSNGTNYFASTTIPGATSGLADPGGNGYVVRTSLGITQNNTIGGTAGRISVSNPDGTSGFNTQIDIDSAYSSIGAVAVSGTPTSGQVPTATGGTTATWQTPTGGTGGSAGSPLFVQTASVSLTNTTTETSLDGTVAGSKTIPVNWFTAIGSTMQVCFGGYLSADAVTPGTLRLKLKFGSTIMADTGAVTLPAGIPVNTNFSSCVGFTARTVGASGTIIANNAVGFGQSLAGLGLGFLNTTAVTVDTTATQVFTLTAQWGTADVDNTITLSNLVGASPGSAVSSVFGQTGAVANLSGDVTTTGSSATTIANSAVTNAKILNSTIDLTTKVTGVLPVANGGTGTASTLTGLVRGSGTAMTAAELSGDVTTSGSNAATIANNAVTNAKIANTTIDVTAKITGAVPIANGGTALTSAWARSLWSNSAGCNNATAGATWDLPTANAPTPNCFGTSWRFGALDYADSANTTATFSFVLPTGWTGATDFIARAFINSTSQSVKLTIATICVATSEDILNPTFNTAQTVTVTSPGTANQQFEFAQTGLTTTGCAAGELMIVKVGRDVTDTSTVTFSVVGAGISIRITPQA